MYKSLANAVMIESAKANGRLKSLANAVMIESAKANGRLVAANAELVKAVQAETLVPVGRMEDVAKAQAALTIWTRLDLVAEKYTADGAEQSRMLVRLVRAQRDKLLVASEGASTHHWKNPAARASHGPTRKHGRE